MAVSDLGTYARSMFSLVAISGCGVACAQEAPPPISEVTAESAVRAESAPRWSLRFEPSAWYMGVGGDLKMPGTPANVEKTSPDLLGFDSPRLVPHARAELRFNDTWSVGLRGFAFSGERDSQLADATQIGTIAFAPGDQASASLDYASFELQAGYKFHSYKSAGTSPDGRRDLTLDVRALGGVRLIDMDWTVARVGGAGGASQNESLTILEPIVGVQCDLRMHERYGIQLGLDVGGLPLGDTSSFSGDVHVAFIYEPTPNFGLRLGYRSAFFNLSDGSGSDEFTYDGAHQGLMFGVVFSF
jgi:hypothetical protein